eukprot:NODE_596_length_6276_cov_0.384977.p1 type:complete len:599 gc:universal NODE_596_length_6276_cov_0.384977:438-2234(+)
MRSVIRKLSTFSNQSKLPRLPIPSLNDSLVYYMASVKAIQDNKASINKTAAKVNSFEAVGNKLRQFLQAYDEKQPNSWLEKIWLDKAYNIWRVPIMVNVNWWTLFRDVPKYSVRNTTGYSDVQLNRASSLVHALLQMNNAINKQLLPSDKLKNGQYMCMNQLKCMFQAYRTPVNPIDQTRTLWPTDSNHIVVLIDDQLFKMQVDPKWKISDFKYLFEKITNTEIDKRQSHVGAFTAIDRAQWASMYSKLSKDELNKESLDTIKNALFAVALDNVGWDDQSSSVKALFHNYGKNRWFDVGLTIAIDNNGRAGCNGEHSPCDAIVPANMFDHILKNEENAQLPSTAVNGEIKQLKFNIARETEVDIANAEKAASQYAANIEVELLHFNDYGSDFIKKLGKCSPDAFIQLVLQLSYYKTHGHIDATYESASTRLFKHGRTETCRSASSEMKEFVKLFYRTSPGRRWELADKPMKSHVAQLTRCTQGLGIDRLFLGLKEMSILHKDELSDAEHKIIKDFYEDLNFQKSNTFILSTSNVSPGTWHYGGFGPVAVNGYGVNYSIANDGLKFSISGWKGTKANINELKSNIHTVLLDFKNAINSK